MSKEINLDWPYAHRLLEFPELPAQALFRSLEDDFFVDEILGFEPSGDGEHLLLNIEKIGQNTGWVSESIAKHLAISPKDIGRCGLKDRHAVTRQWLSIYDPKLTALAKLQTLAIDNVSVLNFTRHQQKLRPGMHQGNVFRIRLRQVHCDNMPTEQLKQKLEIIIQRIIEQGFPNFFGEQRFGYGGGNVSEGLRLASSRRLGRHRKKSIYLSAMRSYLFNQVLAERVKDGTWQQVGHPSTAPLWGRGRLSADNADVDYEMNILAKESQLTDVLEHGGLSQERRLNKSTPKNLEFEWLPDQDGSVSLMLSFELASGEYATSLLRELVVLTSPEREHKMS